MPRRLARGPWSAALLSSCLLWSFAARSAIPATQRTALLDLFAATNGAGWTQKTGWGGPSGTECGWYGVSCDPPLTKVLTVNLGNNNLVGTIPSTIDNLTDALNIILRGNSLSGIIFPATGLTNLQQLDLSGNLLTGSIPALSPSLQFLDLGYNQLSGSIPSLAGLTNLSNLFLDDNALTGGFPSLTGLSSLQNVDLRNNQLSGAIPSFSSSSLLQLFADDNDLSGGIPALSGLPSLSKLGLSRNHLTGSIPDLSGLPSLNVLTLSGNILLGEIPSSFVSVPLGAGGLLIDQNALYSTDPTVVSFVESKQAGWQTTQTIAPTGVSAIGTTTTSVTVSWSPITYSSGPGFYEVYYATNLGGTFPSYGGATPNKSASSLVVTGLAPGTTYYFVVQTTSLPGGANQNIVVSDQSPSAAGTTTSPATGTATVSGNATICEGSTAIIQAALTGTAPWNLLWSDGQPQSVSASPATRTVSPATTTTYSLTSASDGVGTASVSGSATISVNPVPATPEIAAPSSVLPNQTGYKASIPANPGSNYQWSISTGTITAGAGTSSITFTAGASGTVSVSVIEISGGCASNAAQKSIPISGAVSLSLSPGSVQVLEGGTVQVTATLGASQPVDTTITLSSSAPAKATVPSSAIVSAGTLSKSFSISGVSAGTAQITATLPAALGSGAANVAVTVQSSCFTSPAPVLTSPSTSLVAGQALALRWTSVQAADDTFLVESSRNGFAAVEATFVTPNLGLILQTEVSANDSTLSVRVRRRPACGTLGASSNVLSLPVARTPLSFEISKSAEPLVAIKGGQLPGTSIVLKNVGGVSGRVNASVTNGAFVLGQTFADVAAGESVSLTISPSPAAAALEGATSGFLTASFAGGQLSSPLSLTVIPAVVTAAARVRSSINAVTFLAPAGQSPSAQTIELDVTRTGTEAVYLTPSIGPGGSWLTLSSELSGAVPLSGKVNLTLGVDRSRRSAADGAAPLRALLRITPVGGDPVTDSAVVEILDVEPTTVLTGTDRASTPPPGVGSFIIPTTVRASGLGGLQIFASDGWLRNPSATSATADLYFTPDGKDGLLDSAVKKVRLSLLPGSTYRLSDLVSTLFQSSGTSGQLEVRSSAASALSLRSTVESITAGDPTSRYGSEIPAVAFGSGIALDRGELAVPGVDDDATNRANLILTETTGSPATVIVTVNDGSGRKVGELTRLIPAYGKIQIDRVVNAAAPGTTLSGGWAGVKVSSGAGRVVAVATVIDNRSGSFSAILGRGSRVPASSAASSGSAAVQPLAALPARFIVPSLARTTGAFDTQFSTSMSMV
ncbi:MAG: fibronectin type III domain-containing protein, partial [Thermoanaerobaculia bacterium]